MTDTVRQPPASTPEMRWAYEELLRLSDRVNELERQNAALEEKLANS
jgi:hypothetical protein